MLRKVLYNPDNMKKTPPHNRIHERRRSAGRRSDDTLQPDFRELTDNAAQGILIHGNFRPLYANDAFAKLFGYENADEIMAMPLMRPLFPVDLWAQVEEDYNALIHGTQNFSFHRTRGIRKDGTEIWLSVTERVIDWHGAHAVQINAFDITEHMAVEQNMLDSEHRLRAMLEILPVPIYISRRSDGQLLFVNRKTCLLFQQSAGPLLRGKSVDFFVSRRDRLDLLELMESVADVRDVEVKMRTAHGKEFTAELAAIPIDYAGAKSVLVSLNDITHHKQMEAELFQQANTDQLTGIANRRHFLTQAEQEIRRARRFNRALSVMMIDIDHFKPINDTHGHAAGDIVLQKVVKRAEESLRKSDVIGRLGGEEFGVLLPETDLAAATEVATRLCGHIAERAIFSGTIAIPCTVSVGVAQFSANDSGIDSILSRADEALYRAKGNGRNRVEVAGL